MPLYFFSGLPEAYQSTTKIWDPEKKERLFSLNIKPGRNENITIQYCAFSLEYLVLRFEKRLQCYDLEFDKKGDSLLSGDGAMLVREFGVITANAEAVSFWSLPLLSKLWSINIDLESYQISLIACDGMRIAVLTTHPSWSDRANNQELCILDFCVSPSTKINKPQKQKKRKEDDEEEEDYRAKKGKKKKMKSKKK